MKHRIWVISMASTLLGVVVILSRGVEVEGEGGPEVPCFFIFGDSLSDSGNNNDLISLARANYLPYGIDFPGGPKPTGRFSNGRTTVDFIGEQLGLKSYIPPFNQAQDPKVAMKGVNYASGSAGILPETGAQVGGRVPLDVQLQNHEQTISKIQSILGSGKDVGGYMQQCLYSVWVASNDWMLNYFGSATPKLLPEQFADQLIHKFNKQFETLYQMGARKVVLFGLSPLGCLPTMNVGGQCSFFVNDALQMYNLKLQELAVEFTNTYPDLKISYIDTFGIYTPNMSGLGLQVVSVPCCGSVEMACLPTSIPCPNRNIYAHWDNAHPTEAVNKILATRAFHAQKPTDATPMDISHLVKL